MRAKKPRKPCPSCGKVVENLFSKYCSNSCQQEFQHKTYIERWKAGLETGYCAVSKDTTYRSLELSAHVKRYIFKKFESSCSECGWCKRHPINGNLLLHIDHKDGNFFNSLEDNLNLLCPNCHSLTPNHGNLNRGSGREARLKSMFSGQ